VFLRTKRRYGEMTVVHIPGKKSRRIMLYALSTCGWCQKTKKLLDDLGVEYDYEYVDQLHSDEKEEAVRKVREWNPSCSFPTLVLDNKKCIVGYRDNEIREAVQ
jgi:glutaredoxin-like protein NrdH